MRPSMPVAGTGQRGRTRWTDAVQFVALAGVLTGAIGFASVLAYLPNPSAVLVLRYVVVGLAYLGLGWLLARRGLDRVGLLFALTGALWFFPEIQDSRVGVLVGLAVLLADVYRVTFVHSILAFPDGRIRPRVGTWFVGAAYVLILAGGTARALTYQPYFWESCVCPHNGFGIWRSESVYNAVDDVYRLVGLLLAISAIVLVAIRARSSRANGVSAMPLWTAFAALVVLVISGIVRDQVDLSRGALEFWLWVDGAAFLAVAGAFAVTRTAATDVAPAPRAPAPSA